jgi:hypothetical protein
MINPESHQIEDILGYKLVGYNCRRYDNHILYAALMGYTNEQLYKLSKKIISGSPNALFREAYDLSYADIYDFASEKKSLKKWEIELGIPHKENDLPWDEPVAPEKWKQVEEYCVNDVEATEVVFENRKQDFIARQILADLSGLNVNASTQQHTSKIVFGNDKRPQEKFVYTDLSEEFPGYKYEMGKSTYRDEITGEGRICLRGARHLPQRGTAGYRVDASDHDRASQPVRGVHQELLGSEEGSPGDQAR